MQRKTNRSQYIKALMLAMGVFVVALIVVLVLLLTGSTLNEEERQERFLDTARYIEGVSVGGVDVSGQSFIEALENSQLIALADDFADSFIYTFTVGDTTHSFSSAELGLTSNLEQVLKEAMFFGQHGDGETVKQQKQRLQNGTVNFDIGVYGEESVVQQKIQALKLKIDALPRNAVFEIEDDLKSDSDASYLMDLEGVTLVDEVIGTDVDAAALSKLICSNLRNGDYSVVEAPALFTHPDMNAQRLKENTQKMGEMTTYFEGRTLGHPNRVNNIRIFANIINGTILEPGIAWSINEAAGPRNAQTAKTMGWTEAPGISNGRYEGTLGGGVCQISSTVYNAAIRAEMEIVERRTHSWPSSYVPDGMDATISTNGPDLVISNPYDSPVYMVAYINEDEYKLTVQFYGPPLPHGYKINFINEKVGQKNPPASTYHYNATQTPDGKAIGEGKTEEWVKPRKGETWRIYKQYLDSDGNVVKSERFGNDVTYRAFAGIYYVNGPDPSTVLPTLDDDTE